MLSWWRFISVVYKLSHAYYRPVGVSQCLLLLMKGKVKDSGAEWSQGPGALRGQVHQDYETPSQDKQLQLIFGSAVCSGFSTNTETGVAKTYHRGAEGILRPDRQLVQFPSLQAGTGRNTATLYTIHVSVLYLSWLGYIVCCYIVFWYWLLICSDKCHNVAITNTETGFQGKMCIWFGDLIKYQ